MSKILFYLLLFLAISCGKSKRSVNRGILLNNFCPDGYVAVVGNSSLGTGDFCVMQFEARRNNSGDPESVASGNAWNWISAIDAFSECQNISIDGYNGEFALISNREWMTIARDIETTAVNWSGGAVNSGVIYKGHSDNAPSSVLSLSGTNDPYFGTGNSANSSWEQARTFTLSNGSIIWDFSGNFWEWVDWSSNDNIFTTGVTNNTLVFIAFPQLFGSLTKDDIAPFYTDNDHTRNFGRYYIGPGGFTIRGGNYNNTITGAFALFVLNTDSARIDTSFRCVYRF